jgi:hypothetical protein
MYLFVWVFGYICVFEVLSCVLWLYNSEFVGSELGSWKRYYIRIFVFFFFGHILGSSWDLDFVHLKNITSAAFVKQFNIR